MAWAMPFSRVAIMDPANTVMAIDGIKLKLLTFLNSINIAVNVMMQMATPTKGIHAGSF